MPKPNSSKVLLVEGDDDEHFVRQLCTRCWHGADFAIEVADTIERLLGAIGPALIAPDREVLGILVDADDDPLLRWNEVRDRLDEEKIRIPASSNPKGTILEVANSPRIGIWMMPDNRSPGELEDFAAGMIPSGDPVWPVSQRYVEEIPAEHRRFRSGKVLRAKVYAWLATRQIPGRMGAAIGAEDLRVDVAGAQEFVQWLRDLFR